jgi:hypothetical protein
VEVRGNTVYWENESFDITVEEANTIADDVRRRMRESDVDSVVVDNREARGAWPSDVDQVWNELMTDMYAEDVACATICPSVSNALQLDKLSRENGTDDLIQAFEPGEEESALEFVGAPSLRV